MYEDRTQNNDPEIHDTYDTPCHIIYSHLLSVIIYHHL